MLLQCKCRGGACPSRTSYNPGAHEGLPYFWKTGWKPGLRRRKITDLRSEGLSWRREQMGPVAPQEPPWDFLSYALPLVIRITAEGRYSLGTGLSVIFA